jgi:hypothetical protein
MVLCLCRFGEKEDALIASSRKTMMLIVSRRPMRLVASSSKPDHRYANTEAYRVLNAVERAEHHRRRHAAVTTTSDAEVTVAYHPMTNQSFTERDVNHMVLELANRYKTTEEDIMNCVTAQQMGYQDFVDQYFWDLEETMK